MTTVSVDKVELPAGSTIGYGYGRDVQTLERVKFAGDHRPMRYLGEALLDVDGDGVLVEVEDWQVVRRES